MSNALVRAAHGLTLSEKRLLAAAIAKLDSIRAPIRGEPPRVKISANEFAETFSVSSDTAYDELRAAVTTLFERQIRFVEPTRRGLKERKIRWVGGVTYHHGEGWVELAFWHEVVPHVVALRKSFTSYKLAQASALRSIYSWRFLELFSQFTNTGLLRMSIDEFCHAMDAPESCRKDFFNLRKRIIEPAVTELITKDGYLIEWTPKKIGRKVAGLEFLFKANPQGKLNLQGKLS
jgi:plasmid replication initiation protein